MGKKKPLFGVSNYIKKNYRKRPGRHKKSPNKHEKRMGKYRGWHDWYIILYWFGSWAWTLLITAQKKVNIKTVTLNVDGISQGQWSTFLLELNIMKKAWRPYGVSVELKAKNIKRIIAQGTNSVEKVKRNR